ncbi:MAG: PhnO-related protein [uncultured Paraburkholderia sp.]|nr:MAG: PhnO-related protein [uncultured Paraburkholderia sp.]CAH2775912.1 MAG: PhnO-related protein [uncultured Paraburkholderia sp.]CAH2909398.1 MAG: PhnO-related protein [uncultured Paraburkholderia sp.]
MDRIPLISQEPVEGAIQGYVIKGITHAQKTFRLGDWPERLTGVITLFVGERRPGIHIACTRLAMPVVDTGTKCLFVSEELRAVCADAFDFVMRFARDNDLPVEIRRAQRLASAEVFGEEASGA